MTELAEKMKNVDRRQAMDELRDTINWIAVFEEEYDIPAEVVQQLRTKLERIGRKLQQL